MAECLLSGAKFKKGTAVVITRLFGSCPDTMVEFCPNTGNVNRIIPEKIERVIRGFICIFIE
jgi:hypothetical protein